MGVFRKREKWYIDFYVDGKRVRECVGDVPRKVAQDALVVRKAEIAQGRYQLKKKNPDPTFFWLCREYRAYLAPRKEGKALKAYESRLKHLEPFLGPHRLSQISPFLIEKYIRKRRSQWSYRKAPVSPATVNRELTVLKRMFTLAIQWEKAERNPVSSVKLLREDRGPDRVLDEEEEEKLLGECAPHVQMAVRLALGAGLRLGEVLGLRWGDVDLRDNVLRVVKSKSGKMRSIPLNAGLRASLVAYRGKGRAEHVFPNDRTGKPLQDVKTGFSKAVRRAGIPHCRFHDLRHTFATRLVTRGADLATVSQLLGHSSIEMTMRYAHPSPEDKRRAVGLLDGHQMDTTSGSTRRPDSGKVLSLHGTRP